MSSEHLDCISNLPAGAIGVSKAQRRLARVTSPPDWADGSVHSSLIRLAEECWPFEVGGFLTCRTACGPVFPRSLRGTASPSGFRADGGAVLSLLAELGFDTSHIVGAFHSHPDGAPVLSRADADWLWWGTWHALVVRVDGRWAVRWFEVVRQGEARGGDGIGRRGHVPDPARSQQQRCDCPKRGRP